MSDKGRRMKHYTDHLIDALKVSPPAFFRLSILARGVPSLFHRLTEVEARHFARGRVLLFVGPSHEVVRKNANAYPLQRHGQSQLQP